MGPDFSHIQKDVLQSAWDDSPFTSNEKRAEMLSSFHVRSWADMDDSLEAVNTEEKQLFPAMSCKTKVF